MSDSGAIAGVPKWLYHLMNFHPFLAIFSFVINSIHLIILSQKSLRTTSSINVIMVGIAVSNLYVLLYSIVPFVMEKLKEENQCNLPSSYELVYLSWISGSFEDNFRRCDALLGILMAVIRVLVLMKPNLDTSERFRDISGPLFGWKTNIFVLLSSSMFSVFQHFRSSIGIQYTWFPFFDSRCQSTLPENYTQPVYDIEPGELSKWVTVSKIYVYLDGIVSKIVPALLFPILTVILIGQLRKIAESHAKMMSNTKEIQSTRTTKLVVCTAIAYIISTIPIGMVYCIQPLCEGAYCTEQVLYTGMVTKILLTLTSTVHLPICYFLSTPYRNTAKLLLGIQKKKNNASKIRAISQSSISSTSVGKI